MTEEFSSNIQPEFARPNRPKKDPILPFILSASSLFIALAALVIMFITAKPKSAEAVALQGGGNLSFAWINSDTIWNHYDFVTDVKDYLAKMEQDLQNQYNSTVTSFQKEYDNYLKIGSTLSLGEQKKREEALAKKQQSIQELDASLTQQLVDEKTARNMEVHDTIDNYIARYNKDKKYTFILERSYGGTVMYADPSLDITNTILKGLNEEYKGIKKSKEVQKEK